MRLSTVVVDGVPRAAARRSDGRLVDLGAVLGRPVDLMEVLDPTSVALIAERLEDVAEEAVLPGVSVVDAPYRHPGTILGIGLNYGDHAGDLGERAPQDAPASFIKGDHTICGPGEAIRVPSEIGRVTAEAEVGLVIGRECSRVPVDEAFAHVAGIVAVLDQTAEDVLRQNPRYLTRVKNYPTFFSFGPEIITIDEVVTHAGDLESLDVATVHNGRVHRAAKVSGMTFSPAELLSFHSHVMPLRQGDILSTGTPGAVGIEPGDVVSCVLGGDLTVLENPVTTGQPGEIMPRTRA